MCHKTLGLAPVAVSTVVQVVLPFTGSLRSIARPWSKFKFNSIAATWFAFWSAAVKVNVSWRLPTDLES